MKKASAFAGRKAADRLKREAHPAPRQKTMERMRRARKSMKPGSRAAVWGPTSRARRTRRPPLCSRGEGCLVREREKKGDTSTCFSLTRRRSGASPRPAAESRVSGSETATERSSERGGSGHATGGEGSPPPPEQGSEEDASPPFCLPSTSTPVAFPAPLSLAFGPSFSASSASRPASAYSLVARGEHGALEAQRRRTKARKQVETADTHESAHASAEVLGSRRDRRLLRGLGSSANATPAFCPSSHLSEEAFSSSLLSPSADPPPALPSWCARSGVPRRLSSPRVSASSGLHEWRMSSSSAAVPELASRSRSASACLSSDTPRSRFSSPRSSSSSSPSVSPHVAVGRLGCRPGDGLSRELSALSAEGKVPADAGEQHGAVGSREARNVSCSSSRSCRASSLRCQPLSNAAHFPSTPAADAPTRREERQSVKQKNARLLPAGRACPPSTPYGDAVALPSAFPPSFESFPPPSSARLGFFESHVYIHPTRVPPPERSALPMRGDAVLAASPFSSFPPPSSALLAFVPSRCLPPLAEPSASSAGSPLSSAFSASPLSAFPAADRFSPLCSAASPSSTQRARRRVYVHLVEASSTGAEKTLGTGLGTDANSPEGGAQSGVGEALMAAERRTSQELSHASVFRALRTWRVSSVAHGGVPGEKRGQEKAKGRRRAGSQAPVPAAEGKEGSRSGTEPEGEEKLIERVVEWLVTDRLHATVFLLDGRDRDTGLDGQTRALGAVGAAGEEASRVQREDSSGSSSLSASRVPSQAFPPRSWRHADACLPSLLTRFEGTPPDASTAGAKGGCERESREGTERPPPPGTLQRARAGLSEKIVSRLFKAKARAQEDAADLAFGLSIFLISNTRVVDLLAAPSSLRASSAAASLLSAAVRPSCLACFARLTPQPSSFDSSLHGAASSSSSPSPSPCSSSPASEPDCDPTEGPSKGRGVSNRLLTTFVRTSREAKTLLRGAGRRLSSLLSQSLSSQKEQEDAPHDRTADRRSDAAGRVPQESDEAQERETLLCVRVQVVSLPEPAAPAPAHATLSLLHLVAPVAGEHVQERAALAGRDAPPAKPAPATPQPSSASNFLLAGASCARLTCSSSRWSSRPPAEAASSRASRALLALLRRYLDLPLAAEPPPAPSASVYAHSSRCAQAPAAAPSASLALAASPGRLSFAEELLAPLLARRAKTFALAVLPSHICEPSCDTVALLDTLQRAALHSPRCVPLPLCALAAAAEEDLPSRRARGGLTQETQAPARQARRQPRVAANGERARWRRMRRGELVSAAPLAARSSRRRGRLPAAGGSSASAASASRPSSAVALRASLSLRPLPRPRAQAAEKGTWISERLARLGRTPRRLSPPRCGEGSLKESRAQRSSAVRRAASSSLAASRGKTHVSSPRAGASSSVGSSASSGAVSPLDPSTRSSVGARREGSAAPGRPRREAPAASAQSQAVQGVAAGPGLATASKSLSRSRLPSPFYPSSRSETQRRLLAASASSAPARPLRPQQASASPLHRELLGPSSSACVARFASSSASPSISFHASARDQPQAAASRERGKEPTAVSEELHRRLHSPARKRELVMQLQNGEREADSETPPGTGASRNGERRERAGSQSAAEDESALGEEGAERRRTRRRKSTLSSPYTEETVPEEERKAANADRQENKSQILPKYLSAKPLLPCGARPRAAPAGLDSALCSSVSSSSASLSSSSCTASREGLTRSPIPRHQSPQSRALRGVRTPQRVELARPPADALGSVEDSPARPRAAGELFERGRHGRGRRLSSPLAHLAGAGCIDPLALRSSSFYAAQRDLAPAAEDVQPWVSPSERLARAAKGARLAADAFEEGRAHEASDAATGRRTRGQKEGKLRGATSEKRARARREPAEASEWSRGQAGGRRLAAAFAEKETPGRGLRAKEDAEASHPRLASDPRRTGRARGRGQADILREEETLLRVREADLQLEIVRLRGLLRRALAGHSQSRETSQSEAGEEDAFQRMEQIDGYEQALEQVLAETGTVLRCAAPHVCVNGLLRA
ncbi:hypothetical protein BESB_073430 [Besnoitia besnoiti]|uniref:Uncharacterized protein n=1 Tax=Besnoitia besnoiti TaxID=94643 RepID=A0A2A9MD18_BESBE|nr:uncharacterized protein BESB_073430 [Besnoitia besnoiti]PFH34191.1 hypothetical protein BESB_073430 [Besnoitia besnoiti]